MIQQSYIKPLFSSITTHEIEFVSQNQYLDGAQLFFLTDGPNFGCGFIGSSGNTGPESADVCLDTFVNEGDLNGFIVTQLGGGEATLSNCSLDVGPVGDCPFFYTCEVPGFLDFDCLLSLSTPEGVEFTTCSSTACN